MSLEIATEMPKSLWHEQIVPLYDVCIIGAGVAGGALAAYLGKHGKKVVVIERSLSEPDRIIGELLQPGGLQKLKAMDLEEFVEGFDAQPIEGYALFMNGDNFSIKYPQHEQGRGFRNGKFIQRIREYLYRLPNVRVLEGKVTELIEENGVITGVKYLSKDEKTEQEFRAAVTVSSDGMFSAFREKLATSEKKITSYFLGLILKNCRLPYENYGHVIVAEPSPCLVYPISATEARILIDFPGEEPPARGPEFITHLKQNIGSQLPLTIRAPFLKAVDEGKFRFMPNHLIPAKPLRKPGAVLLGDSLNMRHPLTGGGMTVALTDVHSLGKKLANLDFKSASAVNEAIDDFYRTRSSRNATINILADALYNVMSNEDLKKACYTYLKRGGKYAAEPISILSAVSRDVKLLLRHFFAVAMFGAGNIMKPFPTPSKFFRSITMIGAAVKIIFPLLRNERRMWLMR